MKNLIAESNTQEWRKRESEQSGAVQDAEVDYKGHKNVLDVIDTVSIKSITDAIISPLDWKRFELFLEVRAVRRLHSTKYPSRGSLCRHAVIEVFL